MNCHPCVRNGPAKGGAPGWTRTSDPRLRRSMFPDLRAAFRKLLGGIAGDSTASYWPRILPSLEGARAPSGSSVQLSRRDRPPFPRSRRTLCSTSLQPTHDTRSRQKDLVMSRGSRIYGSWVACFAGPRSRTTRERQFGVIDVWAGLVNPTASGRSNPVRAAALPIESTASPWPSRPAPASASTKSPPCLAWVGSAKSIGRRTRG
jgi:hypothetical protein